jgi:hypothetical protein
VKVTLIVAGRFQFQHRTTSCARFGKVSRVRPADCHRRDCYDCTCVIGQRNLFSDARAVDSLIPIGQGSRRNRKGSCAWVQGQGCCCRTPIVRCAHCYDSLSRDRRNCRGKCAGEETGQDRCGCRYLECRVAAGERDDGSTRWSRTAQRNRSGTCSSPGYRMGLNTSELTTTEAGFIVRVTGIDWGEFDAPVAVTVIMALYVPGFSPAGLTDTPTVEGPVPEVWSSKSQDWEVTADHVSVPPPLLAIARVVGGGAPAP